MVRTTMEAHSPAKVALELACERLLSLQDGAGYWQGELQTNVTMDAEDMLLREFLGIRRSEETARSAAWIRSQQRPDGTWANFHGGPGELSTTIEAYWALRLAGDPPEAEHMRAAARFIRARGRARARARVHPPVARAVRPVVVGSRAGAAAGDHPAALVGAAERLRLRLLGAPDDRGACRSSKPTARCARCRSTCERAARHGRRARAPRRGRDGLAAPAPSSAGASGWPASTASCACMSERPIGPLRRLALARAERWIVRRQEADGSWGGIQPPWVYSLMALQPVRLSARSPRDEAGP